MRASVPHWTHYDLRRTCATNLGELGIPPHVISAILNHVSDFRGGVHGIYDLTAWNARLLAIVEGREPATTVVALRA